MSSCLDGCPRGVEGLDGNVKGISPARELLHRDGHPEHQVHEEELDGEIHHALHRGRDRRRRTVRILDDANGVDNRSEPARSLS